MESDLVITFTRQSGGAVLTGAAPDRPTLPSTVRFPWT
jgi:hypothetical protein